MTKGGSGKSKTLGRLIFGEKRKQHASPARHRSSTRHGSSMADLPASSGTALNKSQINLHDWAIWRMQLNEQMGSSMNERRTDLKQMRQFLQTNPFYQQHSRDPSNGRYNGVRLLFSIPHAKLKPEFLHGTQEMIPKSNEIDDTVVYEQKKIRSNSDDRTTTSVNSISAVPPMVPEKTVNQLLPKVVISNVGGFLQTNEQMIAIDGIRTRRTIRSSFTASDRIHSTLQKAVKDGNVLEKIKAFEMQAAAAAQSESIPKFNGINHRMQTLQSVAHRTLSPATIHPVQQTISPIQIQEQALYPNRSRYAHPIHHHRENSHTLMRGHESRKGAHVLEPAHGDIILKRRTPSQKTANDEECSVTAITSMALTASQGHHHHHHRNPHHSHPSHHHHHRSSVSRSRHRQEMAYDKRTPSRHESHSRRHHSKQKETITPSAKSSTRRRWLKGRKETPVETPSNQGTNPDKANNRSNKTKKKTSEHSKSDVKKVTKSIDKEKSSSDNNRVYGVPNPNVIEQTKIEEESERDHIDETNTYISTKDDDKSQSKACDTVIQQRPAQKHHRQKLSSTDGEILDKIDENHQSSRSNGNQIHHSKHDDDEEDQKDNQSSTDDDDVFLEDTIIKPKSNLTRHQSIITVPKNESRRFQQQTSNTLRRRASHCSADEIPSLNSDAIKKQKSPITLITRKNHINRDEPMVYEIPQSEQIQPPICNTHTMKKKRSFHTINPTECSSNNNGQKTSNNQQMSKQILHAIMNSMNHNQESLPSTPPPPPLIPASPTSVNDDFFENGPLTNPEEAIANMTTSS